MTQNGRQRIRLAPKRERHDPVEIHSSHDVSHVNMTELHWLGGTTRGMRYASISRWRSTTDLRNSEGVFL
jgi:hypothetical protein